MNRLATPYLFGLLALPVACSPLGAARPARDERAADAPQAAPRVGLWLGVRRDEPSPGLRRAGTLLLDLRAGAAGSLGGTLELRGELGAVRGSEGQTVLCAPKPRAVVTRTATITGGRLSGAGLKLQLAASEQTGESSCGVRFPLGERCEGRNRKDGGLDLICGGDAYLLRRVSLTGTWVFDEERADRSGDTVVQRLRFHLVQAGNRLTGQVDDIRVHVSGDEQSYRCNGRLRYDRQASHRLAGQIQGRQVLLSLGGSVPKSGPCQGQLTLPATLEGQWKPLEDRLVIKIGDDERSLWRRPAAAARPGGP